MKKYEEFAKRSIPRLAPMAHKYIEEFLDYGIHNTRSCGISSRFESQFAERFGCKYGILHANGTATMHSALIAAGIGAGDEVIVPSITAGATAFVALYANAVPIFADIDAETFEIDVKDIEMKITSRTKAIIPVALYGLASDLDPIMELARNHNLLVIEDNAQCYLGYYKGRIVGSIGHAASFSFQGSKHLTCGDGGITITNDPEYAAGIRRACCFGYSTITSKPGSNTIPKEVRALPTFERHASLGYNFRLPEIAAAIALAELERLDEIVAMRQALAAQLTQVVKDCSWLIPQKTPDDCVHSYWTYVMRITDNGPSWEEFRKKFVELGGNGWYGSWLPIYKEPVMRNLAKDVIENPSKYPHWTGIMPDYRQVHLSNTERIQPRLIQMKLNIFDLDEGQKQADILAKAIKYFG
jgi:perosamine synthetase